MHLSDLGKLLGLPVLRSEHGASVDQLILFIHLLMIVLFVGWLLYFGYALLRFRRARNPKADYVGVRNHASNYIEGAVALVEGGLLIGLAVPIWSHVVDKLPKESEATHIRVMAQQFAWNALYPGPDGEFGRQEIKLVSPTNTFGVDYTDPKGKDDVQVLNDIHVPVNKPVIVDVSSKDVIHSFKVIAMRVTQDAIPGLRIPTWFKPTQEGHYQINCAQLCGNGHASMSVGMLVVESEEAYKKWLASKAGASMSFE